jgi:hypothetical protein
MGVADGLRRLAKKEKMQERDNAVAHERRLLEARKKEEVEEDNRRLDRLKEPKAEPDIQDETLPEAKAEEKHEQTSIDQDRHVKIEVVDDEDMPPPPPPLWPRESINKGESDTPAEFSMGHGDSGFWGNGNDSDDDDDDDDSAADFDDNDAIDFGAIDSKVFPTPSSPGTSKTTQPSSSISKAPKEEDSTWKSVHQLTTFRETSVAVADDYLKTQGIKLSKKAALKFELKDKRSYRQGIEDAAKIDVRRRRLKGADDVD